MPLLNEDDIKINDTTKKILIDYLIHNHCTDALIAMGFKDVSILENCKFRDTVCKHILQMECDKALDLVSNHEIFKNNEKLTDLLLKQVFIETVYRKDYGKAIRIAQEYMASGKCDKDVFSVLGYKNDNQMIESLGGTEKRKECSEKVNEMMMETGNKKSMLWYLCNQQKSILNYSKE